MGQGNDLHRLGRIYIKMSQLEDAKRMFEEALNLHKQAQNSAMQKIDQMYLNKVLSVTVPRDCSSK
jgi:uncharacterized protein HemY